MEVRAVTRFVHQSPRKLRIVMDEIRGGKVGPALNYLHFSKLKASAIIEKTLRSAVANFLQRSEGKNVEPEDLVIKEAYIDGGPTMKRFRAAAMGRASRILRRTSHVTITVTNEIKRS